jgi:hypothetical protein
MSKKKRNQIQVRGDQALVNLGKSDTEAVEAIGQLSALTGKSVSFAHGLLAMAVKGRYEEARFVLEASSLPPEQIERAMDLLFSMELGGGGARQFEITRMAAVNSLSWQGIESSNNLLAELWGRIAEAGPNPNPTWVKLYQIVSQNTQQWVKANLESGSQLARLKGLVREGGGIQIGIANSADGAHPQHAKPYVDFSPDQWPDHVDGDYEEVDGAG